MKMSWPRPELEFLLDWRYPHLVLVQSTTVLVWVRKHRKSWIATLLHSADWLEIATAWWDDWVKLQRKKKARRTIIITRVPFSILLPEFPPSLPKKTRLFPSTQDWYWQERCGESFLLCQSAYHTVPSATFLSACSLIHQSFRRALLFFFIAGRQWSAVKFGDWEIFLQKGKLLFSRPTSLSNTALVGVIKTSNVCVMQAGRKGESKLKNWRYLKSDELKFDDIVVSARTHQHLIAYCYLLRLHHRSKPLEETKKCTIDSNRVSGSWDKRHQRSRLQIKER